MTYAEKLRDPRWQKKRLKILERDNWSCVVTGETSQTLHVHHRRYFGDPWNAPDEELETVCEWVHEMISEFDKPLRKRWRHVSIPAKTLVDIICKAIETEASMFHSGDWDKALEGPFWHLALFVWVEMSKVFGDPEESMRDRKYTSDPPLPTRPIAAQP